MKDKREQHGQEQNTEYLRQGKDYSEWRELSPQRPTFEDEDHETNSAGEKYPGHDRNWTDATENVSPQGDGSPGPVTPVSRTPLVPQKRRHSIVDKYTGGRDYDPENSRVPDAGKKWQVTPFMDSQGNGALYPNQGPQTPANKREIQIGWKTRYADALRPDAQVADAMTAPNTPQRKKLRKRESKP